MRRRLFNLAAAVSLLLMLAVLVTWALELSVGVLGRASLAATPPPAYRGTASHPFRHPDLGPIHARETLQPHSYGLAEWHCGAYRIPDGTPSWTYPESRRRTIPNGRAWLARGLAYARENHGADVTRIVSVPCSYLALLLSLTPAAWLTSWGWRRQRRLVGGCVRWGYDLTGNISGVCPECGTRVSKIDHEDSTSPEPASQRLLPQ